jgi:flagellar basal body-associated protein FliL
MERSSERDQRKSRWEPPPDSDLIGIPLILGIAVALLAIALAFVFLGGWGGLIVIGAVLIVALAISYRVVTSSENGGLGREQ